MVLADAEDVEADLVGEDGLFDKVARALGGGETLAGFRVGSEVGKCVDTDFHCGSIEEAG